MERRKETVSFNKTGKLYRRQSLKMSNFVLIFYGGGGADRDCNVTDMQIL